MRRKLSWPLRCCHPLRAQSYRGVLQGEERLMAERVTLTSEQAEALRKLRAEFNDPWRKRAGKEIEWVPLDAQTRPYKVLTLPGTAGTTSSQLR
jgi:hypothetical protein